jgi:hypothetical protein
MSNCERCNKADECQICSGKYKMISGKCIDNCDYGFLYNELCVAVCPPEASKVFKNICVPECPTGFKDDKGKCVNDISVKDIKSLFQSATNNTSLGMLLPPPKQNITVMPDSNNSTNFLPKPETLNNTISNTTSSVSTNTIDSNNTTNTTTIVKEPELPPIVLADQTYDLVTEIMNNAPPADVATSIVSNIARIDTNNTVVDSSKIQTIGTVLDSAIK